MPNIAVLGKHQNGPLDALVSFLDAIGIQKRDVVISDTRLLHPRIDAAFHLLIRQILDRYRSVLVFYPSGQGRIDGGSLERRMYEEDQYFFQLFHHGDVTRSSCSVTGWLAMAYSIFLRNRSWDSGRMPLEEMILLA